MKCPSCGYEDEASALAFNLCTKLLAPASMSAPPVPVPVAVASPPPTTSASAPAATPATPASSKVPSWPNCAVLCFLFIPALTIVLSPVFLHPSDPEQDMGGGSPM